MTRSHRKTVQFVLDGEVIELADFDPTRTVLQYLREDLHRTGTKEGCAEGDCGACTVVVADRGASGRLQSRAINACIQFLPTLDGKELLTVESLKAADGSPHPVQQAMVDCHGSQCGFCTPGFVMSLFALYKNQRRPDRVAIDDTLAGNLCRCTGYRPIVSAARAMFERAPEESESWLLATHDVMTADEKRHLELLQSIAHEDVVALEKNGRRYFAPRDVTELASLLQQFPDATLLAGGTDVGLWVTKQHRELSTVIDTGRVAELQKVSETKDALLIGGCVTFTDLMPKLLEHFPTLEELMLRFASPPIRNAATLGGNVANGSPIGDSMPALLALDSKLRLTSAGGTRELALADFYIDYQKNALRKGEFLEALIIPKLKGREQLFTYKVSKRFDQDISAVCAAYRLTVDAGVIKDARVAYGGLAAIPRRAAGCEAALIGKPFVEETFVAAGSAITNDFEPITDMRASDEYRRRIMMNLLLRAYQEALARSNNKPMSRVYDYGRRSTA
ncbi:MAG: xanthine dehydrogenase small subunit [Woeseia sp.]|nr:xanthine dehydrogenase small subunit [Woeseia sp.]